MVVTNSGWPPSNATFHKPVSEPGWGLPTTKREALSEDQNGWGQHPPSVSWNGVGLGGGVGVELGIAVGLGSRVGEGLAVWVESAVGADGEGVTGCGSVVIRVPPERESAGGTGSASGEISDAEVLRMGTPPSPVSGISAELQPHARSERTNIPTSGKTLASCLCRSTLKFKASTPEARPVGTRSISAPQKPPRVGRPPAASAAGRKGRGQNPGRRNP
jgi:hypothetical protein